MNNRLCAVAAIVLAAVTLTACSDKTPTPGQSVSATPTVGISPSPAVPVNPAVEGAGSERSLELWTPIFESTKRGREEFLKSQPSATPFRLPTIIVRGTKTIEACTVLQADLVVAGGPSGSQPVDTSKTLARAILLADEGVKKNEPTAQKMKDETIEAAREWRAVWSGDGVLKSDPFARITDVCLASGTEALISSPPPVRK